MLENEAIVTTFGNIASQIKENVSNKTVKVLVSIKMAKEMKLQVKSIQRLKNFLSDINFKSYDR